jgi:hypothetical protein
MFEEQEAKSYTADTKKGCALYRLISLFGLQIYTIVLLTIWWDERT